MRIFISYRRSDNDYLAAGLHDALATCSRSVSVFLDIDSIAVGDEFRQVILEQVRDADVVLALIGPAWRPERLHEPDDFIRFELASARDAGKRIVPVLHSGSRLPTASELPSELGWFPHLNGFELRGPRQLPEDGQRLYQRLTGRLPALAELRRQAGEMYDKNRSDDLMRIVEEAWNEHASSPSPALADCCRLAAVALTRQWGNGGDRDLWSARSLSIAFQAGAPNAFAASLLPFFFRLLEHSRPAAARQVLVEMGRLMRPDDPTEFPQGLLMRRLVQEKLAYSYFAEEDYGRALAEYGTAVGLARSAEDRRGELKIRGAMALCLAGMGRTPEAITLTQEVLTEADRDEFSDVATVAERNIVVLRDGVGSTTPYEVV